jgi:hypothetical protein
MSVAMMRKTEKVLSNQIYQDQILEGEKTAVQLARHSE